MPTPEQTAKYVQTREDTSKLDLVLANRLATAISAKLATATTPDKVFLQRYKSELKLISEPMSRQDAALLLRKSKDFLAAVGDLSGDITKQVTDHNAIVAKFASEYRTMM